MAQSPIQAERVTAKPAYVPNEQERQFIQAVSTRFLEMWNLKNEVYPILDHRTLSQYWNDSANDYGVVMREMVDENDPVVPYITSISRNKTDAFIYNLSQGLMYPSVTAQNDSQEIDRVWGQVGRALLEWAHNNDGYPDESGTQKMGRYIHQNCVQGTVHVLDVVTKDGLYSETVPNEEMFLPNFWQTSIQKQPRVYRVKLNTTYQEAESLFSAVCPNFDKYVTPGNYDTLFADQSDLRSGWEGIVLADRVQILFVYEKMTPEQLKKEKSAGRVNKKCREHRYFNVLVNGIPMFPVDNILPYRDGYLPISVGRHSFFADSGFYWGESAPNKFRYDKKWRDGWMTLLRHKGKLNVLRPQISLNGNFISDEIYIPGNVMNLQQDPELTVVEGVGDPVSTSDIQMMQMADREIDQASVSGIVQGQPFDRKTTAREAVITNSNAQSVLDAFSQQIAHFVHARTFPLLIRLCQFLPRRTIKKLVVPQQVLSDGTRGNVEIIFKKLKKPDDDGYEADYRKMSREIASEQIKSKIAGNPKEMLYVNMDMLDEITFYLKSDVATFNQNYDMIKKEKFNERAATIYLARPDVFNQQEVGRQLIQVNEDDDSLLLDERALQEQQQAQQEQQSQQSQPFGKMNLQPQQASNSPDAASMGQLSPMAS